MSTHTQFGVQTTFGYDNANQLTSESRTGYSASYTYDGNGNRLTKSLGGTTENYTYDDGDKLDYIQVGGVTTKDYGYDSCGRTTSVVTGAGTTTLAYDYESRLTTITYPNSSTNTFAYNGLDTRVSKVDSSGTSTYRRDGVGVTAPVLSDGSATYTPSISERRSGASTYSHAGIKNAESQTNSSQTQTATAKFDAFGQLVTSTGTFKGPFGYGGPFGYQTDADAGLKLLGHRYYDSSTGRFLTRDPVRDGRNWYVYCDSNPIGASDPDGLLRVDIARGAAMLAEDGIPLAMRPIRPLPGSGVIKWIKGILAAIGIGGVATGDHQKERPKPKIPIYRLSGGEAKPDGRSWGFEDPRADPGGYPYRYGVPPYDPGKPEGQRGNAGTQVTVALWDPTAGVPGRDWIIRPALPLPDYPGSGGWPELFFPGGPGGMIENPTTWPVNPPITLR